MTDIRDSHGRFLGVLEWSAYDELRSVRLAVVQPCVVITEALPLSMPDVRTISLNRGRWCEEGRVQSIWLAPAETVPDLGKAHGVILAGATCQTAYGKAMACAEALVRLLWVARMHLVDASSATKH